MNVISIIYPQYWVQPEVTPITFLEHLQIKKSHYYSPKTNKLGGKPHVSLLGYQYLFFVYPQNGHLWFMNNTLPFLDL